MNVTELLHNGVKVSSDVNNDDDIMALGFFAAEQFAIKKMLVSVRLS